MRTIGIFALSVALVGCAGQSTFKRWDKDVQLADAEAPRLSIYSKPNDPPDSLSLKSLPERAAAEYIRALSDKIKDPDKFRQALAQPIESDSKKLKDFGKLPRTLTISTERAYVRPGDRLLETYIIIEPQSFSFVDYDKASTTFGASALGTLSIADNRTASAELDPTFGTVGAGKASIQSVIGTTATENITERPEFTVSPSARRLEIVKTGTYGTDLNGDTVVSANFQIDDATDKNMQTGDRVYTLVEPVLRNEKGDVLLPGKASLKTSKIKVANPGPLYVCARLGYEDRVVTAGNSYYDEGRQSVEVPKMQWTAPQAFQVATADESTQPLWVIEGPAGPAIKVDDGLSIYTPVFDGYGSAEDLISWLVRRPTSSIGKNKLIALKTDAHTEYLTPGNGELKVVPLQAVEAGAQLTCTGPKYPDPSDTSKLKSEGDPDRSLTAPAGQPIKH
jgi:hypothetical protein